MTNLLRTYLQSEGLGTFGTDLFVSQRPDSPDNCIILYDETGIVSDYQSDYGSDWVGVQVMTRGSYSYAQSKIWDIHNTVTAWTDGSTDDFTLVTTTIQTPPAQIDIDEKGRRVFTAHYLFLVTQKENKHRITLNG